MESDVICTYVQSFGLNYNGYEEMVYCVRVCAVPLVRVFAYVQAFALVCSTIRKDETPAQPAIHVLRCAALEQSLVFPNRGGERFVPHHQQIVEVQIVETFALPHLRGGRRFVPPHQWRFGAWFVLLH